MHKLTQVPAPCRMRGEEKSTETETALRREGHVPDVLERQVITNKYSIYDLFRIVPRISLPLSCASKPELISVFLFAGT